MEKKRGLWRPARRVENSGVPEVVVGVSLRQRVFVPDVSRLEMTHHSPRGRLEHGIEVLARPVHTRQVSIARRTGRGLGRLRAVELVAVLFQVG